MKKIIIIALLFLILFCASPSVNAWVPPAGCVADSWIMVHSDQNIYVNFFKDNTFVCVYELTRGGLAIPWAGLGYVYDGSGEVDQSESFMGNMKTADYAFLVGMLGLICGLVFVFGLKQ